MTADHDCGSCGATTTACETRRWLAGRPCCEHCDHAASVCVDADCGVASRRRQLKTGPSF